MHVIISICICLHLHLVFLPTGRGSWDKRGGEGGRGEGGGEGEIKEYNRQEEMKKETDGEE